MPLQRWRLLFVILLCFFGQVHQLDARGVPQIWFSPQTDANAAPDLMEMFTADAAWGGVAAKISVFEVAGIALRLLPPPDAKRILADLDRRGISVGLGVSALSPSPPSSCGKDVESYSASGQPLSDAQVVARLGGRIAYF